MAVEKHPKNASWRFVCMKPGHPFIDTDFYTDKIKVDKMDKFHNDKHHSK